MNKRAVSLKVELELTGCAANQKYSPVLNIIDMKSYAEREKECEAAFLNNGPFWHVDSPGKETPILFVEKDDFVFAMNIICLAKILFPNVYVIAFEIMDNHFHFLLSGSETDIDGFCNLITKKLSRHFSLPKTFRFQLRPLNTLKSFRNNVVYIHRNGYVVDPAETPFSYQWGTGPYYFSRFKFETRPSKQVFTDERRKMFRGRAPEIPDGWKIINGYVMPSSYCSIKFGMALFRDAHHYFSSLFKNVESYGELAEEFKDGEYLTDPELYNVITNIIKTKYNILTINDLTRAQKLDLANMMHFDYKSSNGQIRRVLNLSLYDVNSLFPLTKETTV